MHRMRSLHLPQLSAPKTSDDEDLAMGAPGHFVSGHSRESSAASSASSPVPSTFSNPGHSRWPGSTSSLDTTPESPVVLAKAPLHDLVEDPEERDDLVLHETLSIVDEPFCICDTTNCDHRKATKPSTDARRPLSPEWNHGDDAPRLSGLTDGPSFKRRKSGDETQTGPSRRHSRRWPSITKRWNDRKATLSLSSPVVRSAPPSRSSSLQAPSLRRALASHLDPNDPLTPPATPILSRNTSITRSKPPPEPLEIPAKEAAEDPVDREAQSSTPLLPPIMHDLRRRDEQEEVQSPLQSPSVAPTSAAASAVNSPVSPPASAGVSTPVLSAKPSIASMAIGHHSHGLHHSQDLPNMWISDEFDPWAAKLGHANFKISPEPYRPEVCDHKSCTALLESWELARSRYMRHAARIAENYGRTSQIFKYTEQKWADIDGLWRRNLEDANVAAAASGETPASQSLAQTQPLSRIPTLNDPQQPAKFPSVDVDDMVGPMVRYAKAPAKPSKKPILLRIFTSPASLLAGRRRPSF